MKKIIFILSLCLATNFQAQGFFDSLENLDEVSSVVITKDAFELLSAFPDTKSENLEIFTIAKGLEEFKYFNTEDASVATKMKGLVASAISSKGLTQFMRAKNKTSRVKMYVKSSKNKDVVTEVLLFVATTDAIPSSKIIHLVGQIPTKKLAKIAETYEK